MKYKTTATVALTSFAIFMALVVAGGICVGAGFTDYAKNSGAVDSIQDIIEYVEDYDVSFEVGDTERATADYVRELNSDVEKVVLSTGGCSVDVRNGSEFSVRFTGTVSAGKFTDTDQSSDKAISSADAVAYYDNSGIIEAGFNDGTLDIRVESAHSVQIMGFGANASLGHITVTFPDTYTGSFELDNCFAEVTFAGVDFDELTLDSCMGEINLYNCSVNMLNVTKLAGEVDAEGGNIAGVCFEDIAGEINVDTICNLTTDSIISNIAGEITIELPVGSQLNVTRDDVLGELRIDRAITGGDSAVTLEVSDVVGEVNVEIDD